MTSTRDDDPSAIILNRARGCALIDGQPRNARMMDMSNRLAAGGFVTTVGDLAKFAAALLNGRLVRSEALRQMMTPARLRNGDLVPYGLGWGLELEEWHSDTWVFHGGSTPGVAGFWRSCPASVSRSPS